MKFNQELNEVYHSLDATERFFRKRSEVVLIDVYESASGIESGGVVSFWDADINHKRVLRSFGVIGEEEVVKLLRESKSLVGNSEEESDSIDRIDFRLWDILEDLPQRLLLFAREKSIGKSD